MLEILFAKVKENYNHPEKKNIQKIFPEAKRRKKNISSFFHSEKFNSSFFTTLTHSIKDRFDAAKLLLPTKLLLSLSFSFSPFQMPLGKLPIK